MNGTQDILWNAYIDLIIFLKNDGKAGGTFLKAVEIRIRSTQFSRRRFVTVSRQLSTNERRLRARVLQCIAAHTCFL